ncbi:MAG: hypothetical protein ABR968_13375 [Bacteroidales bacterium]
MKSKIILLLFCSIISTNCLLGQKFYFKADFGYGLGLHGSDFVTSSRTYNITLDTTTYYDTYHYKKISFGTGICPSISLGYEISKYFSLEMNIIYFKEASKVISTDIDYNIVYGYSSSATYQCTFTDRAVYLIPNLILSPNLETINPYFKLGIVFGKGSMRTDNDDVLYNAFSGSSNPFNHGINEWISYGGISFGFKSTVGLEIYFTDKLKLFGELSYNSISYTPLKAKIKKCTLNGVDQLPSMTVSEKEIVFVDEYSTNTTSDPNNPSPKLKTSYNLNALSLSIGVKYSFK